MADRLYLLKPGFETQEGGPYFCSECAMVEGMLGFYPDLRKSVDVTYVAYARPRPQIVAELGPNHQSSPVLVLDEESNLPDGIEANEAQGKRFLDDATAICTYLGLSRRIAVPH